MQVKNITESMYQFLFSSRSFIFSKYVKQKGILIQGICSLKKLLNKLVMEPKSATSFLNLRAYHQSCYLREIRLLLAVRLSLIHIILVTHTVALISQARRVILKILQVRLKQYVNC